MITEIREFGWGDLLVVFTDNEATRKQIKALGAYKSENGYYDGANRLLAVDLFLDRSKLSPDRIKQFKAQMRAQRREP